MKIGAGVSRKLAVAVEIPLVDVLCEGRHQIVDVDDAHDALELGARPQSQTHARNHAEESIAADHQAEKLAILAAGRWRDCRRRASAESGRPDGQGDNLGLPGRALSPLHPAVNEG